MGGILRVWPWAKPYWRYGAGSLGATLVSVLINLAVPLQISRVIDEGINENNGSLVLTTVLIMIGLVVFGMALSAFATAMAVRMAFHTITDLRRDLYDHTQSFSFANLDRMSSGEVLTRLTSDMTKVLMVLTMGLAMMSQAPILFVGSLLAIVAIDASLAVIVLVMVPVIGLLVWYVLGRSGILYDAVQTRLDRLNNRLQESIQGTEVIKAFVRQDHQTERFDSVADDLANQAVTVNQLVASLMPTLILISSLGISAVLWLGGGNVIAGDLSPGNLVAFISYLAMVAMPMMMFAFLQPIVSAASASMNRIGQVLAEPLIILEAAKPIDLRIQPRPGDIMFEDVSFHYQTDDDADIEDALCHVTLHIPQGQTIAILGATGSGKSTLVHMVPRFYDCISGRVLVGGVDVKELSKTSLRQSVGIALQEPQLFSGTIRENLVYGRPEATLDQVVSAAKDAEAHEFIVRMADGYESHVEQGGANLSGGQRQRMSIARTLIADTPILILDDSTSAVDLETEARIQAAIARREDRTVLLVAQRVSTALGADVIVVLDDGRICAHGTHDELLASSHVYQEIYRSQLGEPAA